MSSSKGGRGYNTELFPVSLWLGKISRPVALPMYYTVSLYKVIPAIFRGQSRNLKSTPIENPTPFQECRSVDSLEAVLCLLLHHSPPSPKSNRIEAFANGIPLLKKHFCHRSQSIRWDLPTRYVVFTLYKYVRNRSSMALSHLSRTTPFDSSINVAYMFGWPGTVALLRGMVFQKY